jgi:Terminase small subunit
MARLRNPRRELFAIEVASGTPLDRAYVAAGFKGGRWARPNASKLAHRPEVAARIGELQQQYATEGGLQAAYIQAKLLPLIEADLRHLFEKGSDGKPRLRNLTELPDGIAAALSSVKVDEDGKIHEFKLASRTDAARTLLQSIGAIIEQHAHAHAHAHGYAHTSSLADRLNAARARARERMILGGVSVDEALRRYPDVQGAEVAGAAEIVEAIMTLPTNDQQALADDLEALALRDSAAPAG